MRPEEKVALKLTHLKKTLALAESCTGGLVSHRLTNIPGSSAFLAGSMVVYANRAKAKFLKVPLSLIQKHGAVSQVVCEKMAQGARKVFGTDLAVAITGIAGPAGGTAAKPVGLVFIGLVTRTTTICRRFQFKGSRASIKKQAADSALKLLLKNL